MTTPTSWEDSVETTIREIRALSSAKCGQIIDTTQVIGSLAQNLNQQNTTSEQDNDAARARELMMHRKGDKAGCSPATRPKPRRSAERPNQRDRFTTRGYRGGL